MEMYVKTHVEDVRVVPQASGTETGMESCVLERARHALCRDGIYVHATPL
jgi:hypothetical protein